MSAADPDDDGRGADIPRRTDPFDEIVAGWRAEGPVPSWPDDLPADQAADRLTGTERPVHREPVHREPVQASAADPGPEDEHSVDEHFIPPEPPPLPRVGRTALVGLALLGVGLLLLVQPAVLGVAATAALPLGLVALAAGLGWLVLNSRSTRPPPDGDGEDDGAVL